MKHKQLLKNILSRPSIGADPSQIKEQLDAKNQSRYRSPDGRNLCDHIPIKC